MVEMVDPQLKNLEKTPSAIIIESFGCISGSDEMPYGGGGGGAVSPAPTGEFDDSVDSFDSFFCFFLGKRSSICCCCFLGLPSGILQDFTRIMISIDACQQLNILLFFFIYHIIFV